MPATVTAPFHLAGPTQARILAILWARGAMTVHQVAALLDASEDGRRAYTTYLTVMRNMAFAGLVTQVPGDTGHRAHVFTAAIGREAYAKQLMGWVRDTYFGGSDEAMGVAGLLAAKRTGEAEG